MQYQDIHLSDMTLYNQIKEAYDSGNYQQALNLMKNDQLNTKRLDAQSINDMAFKMKKEQRNIYANVDDILNAYLERIRVSLSGFKYVGDYNPDVAYQINNVVTLNGEYYYLTIPYRVDEHIAPPEYPWIYVGSKGKDGFDGIANLTFRGEYSSAQAYVANDFVYFDNNFYWAKRGSTGQPLTNTTYWGMLIEGQTQKMTVARSDTGLDKRDIWLEIL